MKPMTTTVYKVNVSTNENGECECTEWHDPKTGNWHRLNGPAREWIGGCKDGRKEWWVDDRHLTEKEFNEEIARRNANASSCDGKVVEIDGKKYKLVMECA